MAFTPSAINFAQAKNRASVATAQSPNLGPNNGLSQSSALLFADRARLPFVDPACIATTTTAAYSEAYALFGENYIGIIVEGTATAVGGAIWGSYDGVDWVQAGTFSAKGETVVTGKVYAFVQIALDTVTGGNAYVKALFVRQT